MGRYRRNEAEERGVRSRKRRRKKRKRRRLWESYR